MKISIRVPEPCAADWGAMNPSGNGRHCAQCDQVVMDLTRASDAELVALFTSDAKPHCARFDPQQLDRALERADHQRQRHPVHLAAFTSLLAVAAGCESIGQVPPLTTIGEVELHQAADPPVMPQGKMMVVPIEPDSAVQARAIIGDTLVVHADAQHTGPRMDPNGTPAAGADTATHHLSVRGSRCDAFPIGNGEPDPGQRPIPPASPIPLTGPADPKDPLGITGSVTRVSGEPIAGAVIGIQGTAVRLRCDARGMFFLRVPPEFAGEVVGIEVFEEGRPVEHVAVEPTSLPCCLPMRIPAKGVPAAPGNVDPLNGVGAIRVVERQMLQGVCIIDMQPAPDRRARFFDPLKRLWNRLAH